ncbi:hypothetical protein Q7P37_000290 [Cladosporium fusiforme]
MHAAETCLNVAIDHRIRELFIPVTLPVGSSVPSAQLEHQGFCGITDYIDSLRKVDSKETDVTRRLAGPYGVTRGITVLLKQPRDRHAFDRGMAATVRDCETLQALHDMFQAVTFRTVGISDVNVIDALPFVRPADEKHATGADKSPFSSETKKKLRSKVRQFLEQIAPSVIMCASQEKVLSDPLADLNVQHVLDTLSWSVNAMFDVIDDIFLNDYVGFGIIQWYRKLLQSDASLYCNTISLSLREFARLDKISRYPDTRHHMNQRRNVLDSCTMVTRAFGTTIEVDTNATNGTARVASAVGREPYQKQSCSLNSSVTARVRNMFKTAFAAINYEYSSQGEDKDTMLVELQFFTDAYLEAAVMVEAFLGELRRESL